MHEGAGLLGGGAGRESENGDELEHVGDIGCEASSEGLKVSSRELIEHRVVLAPPKYSRFVRDAACRRVYF